MGSLQHNWEKQRMDHAQQPCHIPPRILDGALAKTTVVVLWRLSKLLDLLNTEIHS